MLRHAPQFYARIGGVLYLLIIAAGLFAEALVRNRLVVPGDAAATASNITDHAFMFRIGIATDLSTFVCAVALTIILYVLLKPFNGKALGALMAIAGVPISHSALRSFSLPDWLRCCSHQSSCRH